MADSPGKVTDMQQNVFMVLLVPSLKSGFTSDVVDGKPWMCIDRCALLAAWDNRRWLVLYPEVAACERS